MNVLDGIKSAAREVLKENKAEVILGFTKGTLSNKCTPFFARTSQDINNLVWESGCNLNLAKYLLKTKKKAAIIVKGCDSRSIINLIKEKQIAREEIVIIGAYCPSTEGCPHCHYPDPVIADILISQKSEEIEKDSFNVNNENSLNKEFSTDQKIDYPDIEAFSAIPREQRKDYIYQEVSKCIRCYACRNVCPACYCKECFVEENLPGWLGKTTGIADNMIFHLTRAIHLAGRCVDCGACTRACPAGVNLSILNRKLAKDVKVYFSLETGMDLKEELALNEFRQDDPQPFLIGGGKDG
ncbi:MAG: hypothetical protein APF84_18150 [Gracilibacter sp. BRH_c7a]|nr:MAG: hypothetical protein APF84_18150 [Gracilibacter sp. BRH_c7a]